MILVLIFTKNVKKLNSAVGLHNKADSGLDLASGLWFANHFSRALASNQAFVLWL